MAIYRYAECDRQTDGPAFDKLLVLWEHPQRNRAYTSVISADMRLPLRGITSFRMGTIANTVASADTAASSFL